MARFIMTIFGLGLLALGGWLTFCIWPAAVLAMLQACLALGLLLAGVVVTVFALSEVAGARPTKPSPPPAPADEAK
jgi:hypothetical protein